MTNNSKGFSMLNILIVVGIIVVLWIGATLYLREIERREIEKTKEIIKEWREKPIEERGEIIRKTLLVMIEEKNKNLPESEKKLEEVKLDPQETEIWIEELQFKFLLLGREVTEEEIRKCCQKELERYLKILKIL